MKRKLAALLSVVAFLFPGSRTSFKLSAQSTTSQTATTKTLQLAGLREMVIVRRDERGIPYIEAKNDEDLYFAQGFVTASDRLWQMDLFRRNARGELAEIFGNSVLEEDKRHRTLGFAHVVEAEAAQSPPQVKTLVTAYANGVNAYIASLDAKSLPPEFQLLQYKPRPWTPADSLLIVKTFFESLSSTWRLDIMREAMAALPAEKRAVLMPETSPFDVLVVGKDTKKQGAATAQSTGSISPVAKETLLA